MGNLFLGIEDVKEEKVSNTFTESDQTVDNLDELLKSSDEYSTNFFLDENSINERRMKFLNERITPQLLSLIKEDDFEFGQRSKSINLVEEQIQINSIATKNWFNQLYLDYFRNDEKTLLSLLKIVEYLDKELFFPTGQTMAISALAHSNDEIKELGVRILENWGAVESYEILRNVRVETSWLQQYINQVIQDLEEELCLT